MAKNKDFPELDIQPVKMPGASVEPLASVTERSEVDRLKDRIAELEAIAMAKSGSVVATDGENLNHVDGLAPDLNANFEVSVKDSPQGVRVFASDPPNAMARYLKKVGMIHTMHQPEITRIA